MSASVEVRCDAACVKVADASEAGLVSESKCRALRVNRSQRAEVSYVVDCIFLKASDRASMRLCDSVTIIIDAMFCAAVAIVRSDSA
jgi:hypothetical protein